jgi:hypothetical protein
MPTFNVSRFTPLIWLILVCTMNLAPFDALAGEAINTELLDNYIFASEIEAVKAMKQHCMGESSRDNAEHVGAILQSEDGRFMVTHGQANPGQESVTFSVRRPPSLKIVALWHTHGAPGRRTERFSITDGQAVRQIGLPFYLITPKGKIKVLEKVAKGKSTAQTNLEVTSERTFVRKFKGLILFQLI